MIRINGIDRDSTLFNNNAEQQNAYHLAQSPNEYEIQRTNNFEFVVTQLDNLVRAGSLGVESSSRIDSDQAQEVLRISNVSAPIPHFNQGTIEVKKGNSTIKFAGVPTFSAGTVKFNDYIGADTKAMLMAWQNLSYNVRTQKVGLASDYKKEAWLIEYSPDYQQVRKWILHGCWVSSLSEDGYDNESNNKNTISCTIEYDWAEIDLTDVE